MLPYLAATCIILHAFILLVNTIFEKSWNEGNNLFCHVKETLMNKPGCRINQRFLNASAFSILLSKDAAELFKQTLDDNHANACILHQDLAAHLIFLLPEI